MNLIDTNHTDQLRVVDVGDGVCKVLETVPDVVARQRARLPETRLKVTLRYLHRYTTSRCCTL